MLFRSLAAVQGGVPLVSVPVSQISDALAQLPQVEHAQVERGWPHTVLITISERIPVAVAYRGNRYQSVDKNGVAAAQPVATPPKGLTVIAGKPGTTAMAAAVQVLQALPSEWNVTGLSAPTRDSVSVTLAHGEVIRFGSGEQADRKVQVAAALLANKYRTIDVSAPDAPTVRP